MRLESYSPWLEQITQPQYPYYHPIQASLFASLSYIGAACLTSISPRRAMTVAILAYAISQLISPFFCQLVGPYEDVSLVPLAAQILQLTSSLVLAKVICQFVGQTLSFKEIRHLSIVFMICLYVSRLALRKFRQQLHAI